MRRALLAFALGCGPGGPAGDRDDDGLDDDAEQRLGTDPRRADTWAAVQRAQGTPPPNILLVLADDVGLELVSAYGDPGAARTPTIDRLADEGVRFDRAYAMPWCSPTRATILTGQLPGAYGLGRAIPLPDPGPSLPESTTSLPELMATWSADTWDTALLGKWHLTTFADDPVDAPLRHGFGHFRGTLGNLKQSHTYDGILQSYYAWEEVRRGEVGRRIGYVTTATVDDGIEWLEGAQEPWFAWVGFHAAHAPWNAPPDDLHSRGDLTGAPVSEHYRAIVEAMDTELGRLLASLAPEVRARTVVIVLGDNGSDEHAAEGGWLGLPLKGTVQEGGVRVPLVITGPMVASPGRVVDELVHVADLFPTVADMSADDPGWRTLPLYGRSLLPLLLEPDPTPTRHLVYAEAFQPNGAGPYDSRQRMVRDARWKLVRTQGEDDAMYDLGDGGLEGDNLLDTPLDPAAAAAHRRLDTLLEAG